MDSILKHIILGKSKMLDLLEQIWKRRAPGNDEDPCEIFENLEYGGNMYQKTRNGNLVMRRII